MCSLRSLWFINKQDYANLTQPDYVDYMMGHTADTHHDIQSLGIDKLRNIYAAADLSTIPKTKVSKVDALKESIPRWGMNPEQLLTKDALAEGEITHTNSSDLSPDI